MEQQQYWETLGLPRRTESALIEAFCPTPMAAILNGTIRQRQPGTNRWPFDDIMVSTWITGSTDELWTVPGQEMPVSRITKLWLHGFLGSGRTVVTASIIEHLIRGCTTKNAVGYYFCSRSHRASTDPLNVLRTLIAQLAQQSDDASQLLTAHLENNLEHIPGTAGDNGWGQSASLDINGLAELLQSVSRCFERVSLVINSVENLRSDDAEAGLVRLLASLVDRPESNIWVLFTSAEGPGEQQEQQLVTETKACPVQVYGRAEDIRIYVQSEVAKRISLGHTFLQPEPIRTGLENYIVDNSNGAWLWATCELDNQCDLARRGSWQPPAKTTQAEPSGPTYWNYGPEPRDARGSMFPYDSYLEPILREGNPRKTFVLQRVLRWIYVGTVLDLPELRLSLAEMCDFLSILLLHHKIETDTSRAQMDDKEIAEIGGQLICISPDRNTFEFRHYTVEPYLKAHIPDAKRQFKLDGQIDSDVIDELDSVTTQLWNGGRLAEAEAMELRLLSCRERLWGPNGNPALAALNNLAVRYGEHGRGDEEEELYTRALRGYERSEKPNRESMFNTINSLGVLYRRRGRFKDSEEMLKRALTGREELFGPQGERTLETVYSLGRLYAQQDRLDEAAPIWERHLQGQEKLHGPNHVQTLVALHDLGSLYMNQDRIFEAIPLMERALAGYERTKGAEDKLTLEALNTLVKLYLTQGRLEKAEAMLKRGVQNLEELLGPEHDDTVCMKRNLGTVYWSQGRHSLTVMIFRELLQRSQKAHGPEHVSTGNEYSNLAAIYHDLDQLLDAEVMGIQALRIYDKSKGPKSIESTQEASFLGLLYAKQDRLDKAQLMWERSARGLEEVKGPDDLATLGDLHNLGRVYMMQFRMADAEATLKRAFEGSMRALGPDHSLTRRSGRDLALLYENQGKMYEGRDVYERLGDKARGEEEEEVPLNDH